MKIIIVGCGKIGTRIVETVSKEGHNIIVVDLNNDKIEEIVEKYDVMGICGNGATMTILKEAGCKGTDLVIATTDSDELNILTCMCARMLGAKQTIARVREPEYVEQSILMKDELGLSMIVNPDSDTAEEINNIISVPSIYKIEKFAKNKVNLFEIEVESDSLLKGKSLIEIGKTFQNKILVCCVIRKDEVFIPQGSFVVEEHDHLYITSSSDKLINFLIESKLYKKPIKSAIIVGGGRIARYLTDLLLKKHIKVKIIEYKKDRCEFLAQEFPNADIIFGDGSNHDLLIEEGIENVDSFITLTDIDEENIILSMFANKFDIDKVITKIKRNSFGDIISDLKVASVVNSTDVCADKVISYIRALNNKRGSDIVTLYKLIDERAEAIEFIVNKDSKFINKPLKDLNLIDGSIIASIIRNNEVIIPRGNDSILLNDHVVVITTKHSLNDLSEIFK